MGKKPNQDPDKLNKSQALKQKRKREYDISPEKQSPQKPTEKATDYI